MCTDGSLAIIYSLAASQQGHQIHQSIEPHANTRRSLELRGRDSLTTYGAHDLHEMQKHELERIPRRAALCWSIHVSS